MATKTITVTEDAYEAIKRLKYEEESFSDLFKRLAGTPLTVKDIIGICKPDETGSLKDQVLLMRKQIGLGLRKRIDYASARLKRIN